MEINTQYEIAAFAIVAILILETIALLKGVDGIMFGASMTTLGVTVGWICKTIHVGNKKTK